jgi:hypothetical protein
MDEPTSVEPAKCGRQGYCESKESPDLHRLVDEAVEGLASCVFDDEHRPPVLAHQVQRQQRPRSVKVVLEFVFVCEAVDAIEGWMRCARYESVPGALNIIAPQFAKDAFGVFPQHFYRVIV